MFLRYGRNTHRPVEDTIEYIQGNNTKEKNSIVLKFITGTQKIKISNCEKGFQILNQLNYFLNLIDGSPH